MKIKYVLLALSAITITGIHAIVNPELRGGKIRGGVPTPESMKITSSVDHRKASINASPIINKVKTPSIVKGVSAPKSIGKYKPHAATSKQLADEVRALDEKSNRLKEQMEALDKIVKEVVSSLHDQIMYINGKLGRKIRLLDKADPTLSHSLFPTLEDQAREMRMRKS